MTIECLKKIFPLLILVVHGSLSNSYLTFYKVGGIYLKSKSYLSTTTGNKVCALNCMTRIKCHGFSYRSNECLIGESPKAWTNASQDMFETWMRLPLRLPKAISCSSDFVYDEITNACFKVVRGAVQFDHARKRCAKAVHGGKLVSMDDPNKYNSIQTYLIKNRENLGFGTWIRIGASRSAASDEFTWENGQTLSLKDKQWCMHKPTSGKCLSLRVGTWGSCFEDTMCQTNQDILCENLA